MSYLENDFLQIKSRNYGGEITSIISKKTGTEYLWNTEPKYWEFFAPVLFPIVGKLNHDEYRIDGKAFKLSAHGFSRTTNFELIESSDTTLTYELKYNENTLKVYPFKFSLKIKYILCENKITTTYIVENLDDKNILFSIGGHPAFSCPMLPDEKYEDYYLEFAENETLSTMRVNNEVFFTGEKTPFLNNEKTIPLTHNLFKENTVLAFENTKSNSICLKSKNHNQYMKFDYKDFPVLAMWTNAENDLPFVCIEPWFGHADNVGFDGELSEKSGILSLNAGEKFSCEYGISICE